MLRFAVLVLAVFAVGAPPAAAEDGSDLWLRYEKAGDKQYRRAVTAVVVDNVHANDVHRHTPGLRMEPGSTERLVESSLEAARDELVRGLSGLLGRRVPVATGTPRGAVVVGTRESSATVRRHVSRRDLASVGDEGYVIRSVSGLHRHRRQHRARRPLRELRLPAPHADRAEDHAASTSPTSRGSRTATSTTGRPRACTPATTRRAPAG